MPPPTLRGTSTARSTDNMLELRYPDRRRVHNLKYYTWVEQQGKTYDEIQAMWIAADYWTRVQKQADEIDALIDGIQPGSRAGEVGSSTN